MTDEKEALESELAEVTSWSPTTDADKEAIREQLGRILSSALFRNSKRFPLFLRFTVEHALAGGGALKERTIGHEVFGRPPAYDTAQDPVVRMTAAEVRKRLAQYYQAPEHASEPAIVFQPGSYVPEFVLTPVPSAETAAPSPADVGPSMRFGRGWVGAAVAIGLGAVVVAAVFLVNRSPGLGRTDAVTRFWAPLLASPGAVLICIGDPSGSRPGDGQGQPADDPTIQDFLRGSSVRYTDSVTLALIAGELASQDKAFRVRRPAATELKDLREGPVVLIGGFNNPWTLRLSEGLRFQLAADAAGSYIRDSERPAERTWQAGDASRLLRSVTITYGLVTRMADPATGHSVLTVSGLVLGTKAAAECLVDGACLSEVERLRGNRDQRNVQFVVSAAVIGEDSGAPRVVAVHTW